MTELVPSRILFVLNMTGFVVNMTEVVLKIDGFVLNMTVLS